MSNSQATTKPRIHGGFNGLWATPTPQLISFSTGRSRCGLQTVSGSTCGNGNSERSIDSPKKCYKQIFQKQKTLLSDPYIRKKFLETCGFYQRAEFCEGLSWWKANPQKKKCLIESHPCGESKITSISQVCMAQILHPEKTFHKLELCAFTHQIHLRNKTSRLVIIRRSHPFLEHLDDPAGGHKLGI